MYRIDEFIIGKNARCNNCIYHDPRSETSGGKTECRRYPVTSIASHAYWCGEWVPVIEIQDEIVRKSEAKHQANSEELFEKMRRIMSGKLSPDEVN